MQMLLAAFYAMLNVKVTVLRKVTVGAESGSRGDAMGPVRGVRRSALLPLAAWLLSLACLCKQYKG